MSVSVSRAVCCEVLIDISEFGGLSAVGSEELTNVADLTCSIVGGG